MNSHPPLPTLPPFEKSWIRPWVNTHYVGTYVYPFVFLDLFGAANGKCGHEHWREFEHDHMFGKREHFYFRGAVKKLAYHKARRTRVETAEQKVISAVSSRVCINYQTWHIFVSWPCEAKNSPKFTRTREETAELTASREFVLSCFLSCAPGFREHSIQALRALRALLKLVREREHWI